MTTFEPTKRPYWATLVPSATAAALFAIVTVAGGAVHASAADIPNYGAVCLPRPAPLPTNTALTDVTEVVRGRLHTYSVTSPAVGVTHVNVLLPERYTRSSSKAYPVLYLLHGALSSYADWASTQTSGGMPEGGNVEALIGKLPIIVVMPDDSPEGSYSDWFGISTTDATMHPVPSTPSWETYHIDELIPWVDRTFHTQTTAAGRAIAGLSSGGGGAAKYATAHPGLFGFVGMFSGALDNDLVDARNNWYSYSNILDSAGPPDQHCTFGNPFTDQPGNQAYYWHDNDPTYEASNLAGVELFVASGNGIPTAADTGTNPALTRYLALTESVVDDMSHHFVAALRSSGLGANVKTDFYGDGTHAWSYWQQDLVSYLHWLQPQLNRPAGRPSSFSFLTARASSGAWGWRFGHRSGLGLPNVNTTEGFVYLRHVSLRGLAASGNGTLQVTTPRGSYRSRSIHQVTAGRTHMRIAANRAGQLTFTFVVGPTAASEQLVFPPSGPPPGMATVEVAIR